MLHPLMGQHVVHNKGVCFAYLGDTAKAKACFSEALTLHPSEQTYMQMAKVPFIFESIYVCKRIMHAFSF